MLGRLNHVAIAVKDAEKAAKIYGGAFGAEISGAVPLPEHGVITVFVTLPNTKIEFIQPLGEASPSGWMNSILVLGRVTNTVMTPCSGSGTAAEISAPNAAP